MKIEVGKFYKTRDGRKVGPMREFCGSRSFDTSDSIDSWRADGTYDTRSDDNLDLISEWTDTDDTDDTPKTWGEMSDGEKGALLLAHHEGKVIEVERSDGCWVKRKNPPWALCVPYRIKPAPVVGEVVLKGWVDHGKFWQGGRLPGDNYRITFTTTDGEPDLDSIKMEKV